MATDWEPILDTNRRPTGRVRPATRCEGNCKESMKRTLGCGLESHYREQHPEHAICAGYLRTLPAWEQWTFAIKCATITTDPASLPHVYVLAERWYSANLK